MLSIRIFRLPSVWMLALLALAPPLALPALGQDSAFLVRVDAVKTVPLSQTVPVLGRLVARRGGVVAARINGPVEEFYVEVGDRVEAGQVIAALNQAALKAKRDLAAGQLAEAQAERATKKAELALAEQAFERLERLKTSAAFSQARYDDQRQQVAIAEAGVREAASAISSAQADLELAEINLYNAEVRAPYAGVVVERLTEAGAYVQVGAALISMIGDRTLEIEADVPFQHLSGLRPGIEIQVELDDGTRHEAVVRAMLPTENPLTRTRTVRLVPRLGETRRPLAHDQSVTLQVPIGPRRDVLSVHKDAIVQRQGQDMVFLAQGEDAVAQPVTLGSAVGSRFEVLQGLKEGDQVVVRGNERLKPGDKIRIDGAS